MSAREQNPTAEDTHEWIARMHRESVAKALRSDAMAALGWTERRTGAAVDLLDSAGRRVAWLTSDGRVYLDRACLPWELRRISDWAATHGSADNDV